MPKTKLFAKLLMLAIACALIVPATASAQTATPQPFIHINDVKPVEIVTTQGGVPGLALDVTFTMLDSEQNVLAGAEPESGTFTISNGSFPAQVQGIPIPWTVAVLVDASANMGNFSASAAYKNARTALADSLGGQQNITFTILKFDDRAPTVMEFNNNADTVRKAVTDIRAATRGNACMHNGISEAITKLANTPGRRAVIVFSASIDNCSQTTAPQVVKLAQDNNVQIYAVGLRGYGITEQALIDITAGTGGLSTVKDELDLGFGFRNMMAILANQFQAKTTMFPQSGPQTAVLDVILKNQSQLSSDAIPFESPQDFIPPPQIALKGVVQSSNDGISFNLDIINPDRIKELRVNIVSKLTGLSVFSQSVPTFGEINKLAVSGLDVGGEYQLFILAVDDRGQQLSEAAGEFKFEPPPLQFAVTNIVQPTLESQQFTVAIEPAAPEGVVKFEVALVNGADSSPVSGMVETFPAGDPLVLPVPDSLGAGEYFFVVRAQDGAGKVLAESASGKFRFTPATWLDRFVAFAQTSPFALVGITGVCCLAFLALGGVLVVFVWRPNSRVKEVEILVPEKQVRQARPHDSGYFDKRDEPPPPPPQRRQEPPPEPPRRAAPPPQVAQQQPASDMPLASLAAHSPATSMPPTQLRKPVLTLGRRSGNDIVLNVDNSSGVSSQHCKILFTNGRYFVQDDGSTYGTTVNGRAAPKGVPTALEDGAVIGLGPNIKIMFRLGR